MSNQQLPSAARRVQAALQAAGLSVKIVELPQSTRTAPDAATAVGCTVGQITKSLIFRVESDGTPLLVLASGTNRVDLDLVSSYVGAPIMKADADFVRHATGYAIGGVPPLGHATSIQTLIDEDLLRFETIWAAGGTPRTVFSIAPAELVQATGGRVVRLSVPRVLE